MDVHIFWRSGLMIVLCAISAWAQAAQEAQEQQNPCPTPPPQMAAAAPPPAIQPVRPEESGPQLPPPYQRLNKRQKFDVFVKHTYSPYTFAAASFDAGLAQATGSWPSYGGGMQGYGKRFGAALADNESGAFFGRFMFPILLHQDPRYLRSTSKGTTPRIGYALSRVLVTRGDNGNKQANFSLILSVFAAAGMSNTYYPREERGFGDTAARAGGDLLSTAGMNVLREFWPDIKRKLKKHEPERLKKLEESPGIAKIEEMVVGPTVPEPCPAAENHSQTTNNR